MTPTSTTGSTRSKGVVTFLDVLGWKGIYDRKKDAIPSLIALVEGARGMAKNMRGTLTYGEVEVKSISDTIVLFSKCEEAEASLAINLHGQIANWLIPQSINAELPVRGAIAYGDFENKDNIFVGKAVDEAAAWHEQGDWIGVHLSPSADLIFSPVGAEVLWRKHEIPNKAKLKWNPYCVDWAANWTNRPAEISAIKMKFLNLGPIIPEISGKFINTLSFLKSQEKQPTTPGAPALTA